MRFSFGTFFFTFIVYFTNAQPSVIGFLPRPRYNFYYCRFCLMQRGNYLLSDGRRQEKGKHFTELFWHFLLNTDNGFKSKCEWVLLNFKLMNNRTNQDFALLIWPAAIKARLDNIQIASKPADWCYHKLCEANKQSQSRLDKSNSEHIKFKQLIHFSFLCMLKSLSHMQLTLGPSQLHLTDKALKEQTWWQQWDQRPVK